ncbi:MAG: DUF2971 domain-containing protein [Desulfarculus sp.]|jgi:hypothetical protein|nr:MAG: DUF2971 domain-containing protein [Desulfarculus sp.]
MIDTENIILEEILSRQPPATLYHYTTQVGLLGIIKTKEIWATHTQYMNDRREYLHAVDLVRQEIESRVETVTDDNAKAALNEMHGCLEGNEIINVCVCSFSEVRDSLSQWRAYGDRASGFAIGFSGQFIADRVRGSQDFKLVQCLYSLEEQKTLIKALVEKVLQENLGRSDVSAQDELPPGGNLTAYLHKYAPILKNAAFSEEKEWRIISRPLSCKSANFDYREGNSMLIPYYKLILADKSTPLELHEIVVGPTPNYIQSVDSVTGFLVRHGYREIPVSLSSVPYRNW